MTSSNESRDSPRKGSASSEMRAQDALCREVKRQAGTGFINLGEVRSPSWDEWIEWEWKVEGARGDISRLPMGAGACDSFAS